MKGVTIFVSDFQRSLTEKLSKDFFNEPSQVCLLPPLVRATTVTASWEHGESDLFGVFSEQHGIVCLNWAGISYLRADGEVGV